MARKRTATLLYSTEEVLTVLEFFAVGDLSTAVLLRAVKGGVNLPQTNISAIFKVHLSLFLIAQFFITQLTLPFIVPFHVFRVINKPHFFSQKTTDEISPIRDLLFLTIPNDPIYQQDY